MNAQLTLTPGRKFNMVSVYIKLKYIYKTFMLVNEFQ